MAAVTICSYFGPPPPQKNLTLFPLFPHLFAMKWWDQMPWSSFSEWWALSQLFHSPLSLSSRGSLVPLHFLPWGWGHPHLWGYWCFSRKLPGIKPAPSALEGKVNHLTVREFPRAVLGLQQNQEDSTEIFYYAPCSHILSKPSSGMKIHFYQEWRYYCI